MARMVGSVGSCTWPAGIHRAHGLGFLLGTFQEMETGTNWRKGYGMVYFGRGTNAIKRVRTQIKLGISG